MARTSGMLRFLGIVTMISVLALAAPALAMNMEFMRDDQGGDTAYLVLTGRIVPEDSEHFRAMVRTKPGREVAVTIDSPGGSVVAAAEIADLVARWRMTVVVPPQAVCASACFLIFAAAPERMASDTARIGVHSVHLAGQETGGTMAMTTALAREMARYGVPDSIIGKTVRTGADEMAWLSSAELRAMRVVSLEAAARSAPPNSQPSAVILRPAPPTAAPAPPPALAALPSPPQTPRQDVRSPLGLALENTPAALVAHEPQAFRDGLRDRTTYEKWFGGLNGPAREGALFWATQRSLTQPLSCTNNDAAFAAACAETQRYLTPADQHRRADTEYRRGWNSFLQPAYRTDVLSAMTECSRSGGRSVRRANFETARDLNGDGQPDYVIDYGAFSCEGGQIGGAPFCGSGGCNITVYFSTAAGDRKVFSDVVRRWIFTAGEHPVLRLVTHGSACNRVGADDCNEELTFTGTSIARRRW